MRVLDTFMVGERVKGPASEFEVLAWATKEMGEHCLLTRPPDSRRAASSVRGSSDTGSSIKGEPLHSALDFEHLRAYCIPVGFIAWLGYMNKMISHFQDGGFGAGIALNGAGTVFVGGEHSNLAADTGGDFLIVALEVETGEVRLVEVNAGC